MNESITRNGTECVDTHPNKIQNIQGRTTICRSNLWQYYYLIVYAYDLVHGVRFWVSSPGDTIWNDENKHSEAIERKTYNKGNQNT